MTLKINDNGTNRNMTKAEEAAHLAWTEEAQAEAQARRILESPECYDLTDMDGDPITSLIIKLTYIHIVGIAVIRTTLVSVIQKPDVSETSYFVVWQIEESLKVFGLFSNLWKPNHRWHIMIDAWEKLAC
mgnify:CR=1 FL=1